VNITGGRSVTQSGAWGALRRLQSVLVGYTMLCSSLEGSDQTEPVRRKNWFTATSVKDRRRLALVPDHNRGLALP